MNGTSMMHSMAPKELTPIGGLMPACTGAILLLALVACSDGKSGNTSRSDGGEGDGKSGNMDVSPSDGGEGDGKSGHMDTSPSDEGDANESLPPGVFVLSGLGGDLPTTDLAPLDPVLRDFKVV